ncbi:hypothetical protein M440DRAFT_257912 [Trichoderma longibrachiatum ATCC 18648]|uniref:Uncharacterized protein n=1 Tax=Trichoderma longibrachiatum ATCC 18648 TaxID=983965 RepID=A0A2T4C9Q1_TRILO|nr:hypothetical protein M440DRAFT_257912 [Trichoderma longibrachiatum ATCC 18648]
MRLRAGALFASEVGPVEAAGATGTDYFIQPPLVFLCSTPTPTLRVTTSYGTSQRTATRKAFLECLVFTCLGRGAVAHAFRGKFEGWATRDGIIGGTCAISCELNLTVEDSCSAAISLQMR